jgi:hypothetical protein
MTNPTDGTRRHRPAPTSRPGAARRFEGAITEPADEPTDSTIEPVPTRPPRPILIEIAAAIMIIGGVTALLGVVTGTLERGPDSDAATPIIALIAALDVLTIVVGITIRAGRAWILALNVVAIEIFLYLTALPNAMAVLYTVLDAIVLFALVRHKWWFDWRPPEEVDWQPPDEVGA